MEAMATVVNKVLVMIVMMAVGYIITKKGIFTSRGTSEITEFLLKIVTPCLIINSFIDSRGSLEISAMLMAVLIPAISMGISIVLGMLFFKKEPEEKKVVLRFSVVFGNVGFMGVPLVSGIVGDKGVIYAAFAIVVFNIICWTYGYRMMNKGAKLSWKTLLFNPGIIGLVIGLPIYFTSFAIPAIIKEPIAAFSSVNTPLAMVIIGGYIARVDLRSFVSDLRVYKATCLRIVAAPALFLLVMLLIRPEKDLFLTGVIQAAMPTAANAVLFAVQYKKDSDLASRMVAVSTALSVITIPIFTIIAQMIV